MQIFNSFKKKRFYLSLLIAFMVLTILTVVTISIFFSRIFTDNIYKRLTRDYSYNTDNINNSFGTLMDQIEQTGIYLLQSPDTYAFIISSDYTYFNEKRVHVQLQTFKNMNPYIYSVIIYNEFLNYSLSSGQPGIDIKQFTQKKPRKPKANSRYKMVYSTIEPVNMPYVKPINTTSFIFSETPSEEGIIHGGIVINIDRTVVEKKLLGSTDGLTLVVDNNGSILFHTSAYQGEDSILNEDFFKRMQVDQFNSGSFRIGVGSDNKIVTFTKNLKTDLYIINIKPYDTITSIIGKEINTVILLSIAVVMLYMALGYIVIRKLYSPVNTLTKMFSSSKYNLGAFKGSEFSLISGVYTDTMKYLQDLEQKTAGKSHKLKEEFLRQLLKSNTIPSDINELKEYCLSIEFSNLILVSIRIDNYQKITSNERYVLETTLCRIIPELLSKSFNSEAVNMYDGEIAAFLNFKNSSQNSFSSLLSEMNRLKDTSRKTLNTSLSIGIGSAANSMEDCRPAYEKSLEMVKHRFVLGLDRIIYQKLFDETITMHLNYPVELENNLVLAIKMNKRSSFVNNLQDIISLLKNCPYSEAVSILFQIMTTCIKTVNQTVSQDSSKHYLNFDELSNMFYGLQTLEHAKEWLIKIFDDYVEMLEKIDEMKNSKYYHLVENAQDYIRKNYHNVNLTIEAIAEMAGYSTPYYFSKIFKEITGASINDYIREVRVCKAKELLASTILKANEISDMTGFTSVSNFFLIFKKDVGLTPLAYREYVLNNEKQKNN